MLITDLAVLVMDPKRKRFVLTEVAPGVNVDEVKKKTEGEIFVAEKVGTVGA
jgi:acyl CoA:acetate/3-ketoacid CoA transferase beta subunit